MPHSLIQPMRSKEKRNLKRGIEAWTPREIDVVRVLLTGKTSKEAAVVLGISFRTVEVHRLSAMSKIGARNFAHVARLITEIEFCPPEPLKPRR